MKQISSKYTDSLCEFKLSNFLKNYISNSIIICIGTDKCIGDCLGPLVGSLLTDEIYNIPIYGTLNNPLHALNLETEIPRILKKHPYSNIIAIDACLGSDDSIGHIFIREAPLKPGKGVGKTLTPIGHISIIGIVDNSNSTEVFSSRPIRLSFIMDMAKIIKNSIINAINY